MPVTSFSRTSSVAATIETSAVRDCAEDIGRRNIGGLGRPTVSYDQRPMAPWTGRPLGSPGGESRRGARAIPPSWHHAQRSLTPRPRRRPRRAPPTRARAGNAWGAAGVIRVLLADDHAIVRNGLAQLLAAADDIEVVAAASDGDQAVDAFDRDGVDL